MEDEGSIIYDHETKEYVPVGRTAHSVIKKERKKRTALRRKLNKIKRRQRW
jgi:hypothetical protein